MRRHPWPVAASVVAVALLSVGLFVTDRQRRISESRFQQLRQLSGQVFALDAAPQLRAGHDGGERSAGGVVAPVSRGPSAATGIGPQSGLRSRRRLLEYGAGLGRADRTDAGRFDEAEASLRAADALVETMLAARPRDLRALVLSVDIRHDRMIVADSVRRVADAIVHATGAAVRIEDVLSARSRHAPSSVRPSSRATRTSRSRTSTCAATMRPSGLPAACRTESVDGRGPAAFSARR